MPSINPGDLVLVTESCTGLPDPKGNDQGDIPARTPVYVPVGTVGVVVGTASEGMTSLVTGMGLLRVPGLLLKRLGMTLPDPMQD